MNETDFNLLKTENWSNLDHRNRRATGAEIQEFIKQSFSNCEQSINNINNTINGEEGINELIGTINNDINSTKGRLTTAEGKLNTIEGKIQTAESGIGTITNRIVTAENTIQAINNKVKTYTVNVGNVDYTQTHNIFRITRPNDSNNNWEITLPNDYNNNNINQKLELRLGPFDELLTITGENSDVQIQNHKINLSEVVDKGEEIIIKVLTTYE